MRRRALSLLLEHGVLGHEPLSVCEVALKFLGWKARVYRVYRFIQAAWSHSAVAPVVASVVLTFT